MQINQTLVDPHLEAIPGFGSFTTGGFSGGDAQSLRKSKTPVYDTALGSPAGPALVPSTDLCWHADRSLHLQVLLFSPSDQVSTDCGLRSKAHTRSRHIYPDSFKRLQLRIAYKVTRIYLFRFCPHSSGLLSTSPPPSYSPFSRDLTLRLVRVMRMRWMATSVSTGALPVSLKACM